MAEPMPGGAPPAAAGGRGGDVRQLLAAKHLGVPGWIWAIAIGAGAGFMFFHYRKPGAPPAGRTAAPASVAQLGPDQTSGIPPSTSQPYSIPQPTQSPDWSGLLPGRDFPNYQPSPAGPKGEQPKQGYYVDWSTYHTVPLGFWYSMATRQYLPLSQATAADGRTSGLGGAGTTDYPERLRYAGWVTVAAPQDAALGIGGGALRRPARRGGLRGYQLGRGGADDSGVGGADDGIGGGTGGGSTPRTSPRVAKILRRRLVR